MSIKWPAGKERSLQRLLRDSLPGHVGQLLLATFCIVIVAAATGGVAWLMKDAVNSVVGGHDAGAAWLLPAAIVSVSAIKGLADYCQSVIVARIGNSVAARYQRRLFDKQLGFEQSFFDAKRSSQLAAHIANNTRAARTTFVTLTTGVARDALTLVALTVVMAINDWVLALLVLAVAPLVMLGLNAIGRRVKELSHSELDSGAMLQSRAQEAFQGIRTVRAYELEGRMKEAFGRSVESVRTRADSLARLSAMSSPLSEIVGGLMIAATILVAGWGEGRSPGEVMSFVTAFLLAFQPARRLMNSHIVLLRGAATVGRIYEVLDEPAPAPPEPLAHLGRAKGAMAFREVSFDYGGKQVLDKVSFEVAPGETVALIGRSGAGKSTVFSLLQGLYRPHDGRIEIDGIDIASLDPQELRQQFSVVSQNTTLFSDTLGENIRMARAGATDEEVAAAAAAAGALDFIADFPTGFDTPGGEQGLTLSGGQVQRISLARAILRDAPILLLDEATAALDAVTAELVQVNLRRRGGTRTTLVIAHRRAMIEAADRVVVLHGGKVVDSGPPGELLERSLPYRGLLGAASRPPSSSPSNAQ